MDKKNVSTIVGIVMIAITFFIFPIVLDGCVQILTHASIASYTGLDSVVEVTPLILYVGLLFGGGSLIWYGTGTGGHARRGYRWARSKYGR